MSAGLAIGGVAILVLCCSMSASAGGGGYYYYSKSNTFKTTSNTVAASTPVTTSNTVATPVATSNSAVTTAINSAIINAVNSVTTPPVITWSDKGHWIDNPGRTLPNLIAPYASIDNCKLQAINSGYNVIGLQYGGECRGGTNLDYEFLGAGTSTEELGGAYDNHVFVTNTYTKGGKNPAAVAASQPSGISKSACEASLSKWITDLNWGFEDSTKLPGCEKCTKLEYSAGSGLTQNGTQLAPYSYKNTAIVKKAVDNITCT
jgi:hypothetical protein